VLPALSSTLTGASEPFGRSEACESTMISGSNMLVSKARRGAWFSVKINEFCAVKCVPCSSAADFEAFISHKPRLHPEDDNYLNKS
jgi:hypothetical protein